MEGATWCNKPPSNVAWLNIQDVPSTMVVCSSAVGCTALQAGKLWVRFLMVSLEFFIDIICLAILWPRGNSASNRNEYQEYFLGGKGGQCIGPSVHVEHFEIWEPQPPGILRASPGLYRDCCTFTCTFTLHNDPLKINV